MEMWYIHTLECYSPIKKYEIIKFTNGLSDPEAIILSEVTQIQKVLYRDVSF